MTNLNMSLANAIMVVAEAENRAALQSAHTPNLCFDEVPGVKLAKALKSFVDDDMAYGLPYNDHRPNQQPILSREAVSRTIAIGNKAVSATFGYANALVLGAAYDCLGLLTDDPKLAKLLDQGRQRQTSQETCYKTLAEELLDRSTVSRRGARFLLRHCWQPLGGSDKPSSTVALRTLFEPSKAEAAISGIDKELASLPGMDNLTVMRDRVDAAVGRRRPRRKNSLLEHWAQNL